MVARPLEGMRPVAALMLLRLAGSDHSWTARLWSFARNWAERRGVPQRREDVAAFD